MKTNLLFYSLLVVTALGIASCDKEKQNAAKPAGEIAGKVTLYGFPPVFELIPHKVGDMSGVTVEAIIGENKFTTVTDSAGIFTFPKVPIGSYIINFHKESFKGFDSLRFDHLKPIDSLNFAVLTKVAKADINIQRVGVQYEYPPNLPPPPAGYPPIEYPLVDLYMEINFLETDLSMITEWIYYSKEPTVSSTNYNFIRVACCIGKKGGGISYDTRGIPAQRLYEKGFKSGDKVYAVAYVGASTEVRYHKPAKGYDNYIFPNHGTTPSNVVSFILP